MEKTNKESINLSFSAIDPFYVTTIPESTQKEIRGQKFISYGVDNRYPSYLLSLYKDCTILQTVVNAIVDYVCGKSIENHTVIDDEKIEQLVNDFAFSYILFGGVFLNVLRNKMSKVCALEVIDFRKMRSDKKNEYFYYSEDFDTKSYGRGRYIELPKFNKDGKEPSSILFIKRDKFDVYPTPVYNGAITACEIQRKIDEFHLNNLENGFTGSTLINLSNGVPTEEIQKEIERGFTEKFCGSRNSGRLVISYSDDIQHSPKIQSIDSNNFDTKYENLSDRSELQIYTAFRCTPALVGNPSHSTGFSANEYKESYSLFYTSVINPIQKKIVNAFKKVFDIDEPIVIEPYIVDFEDGTVESTEEE